MKLATIQRIHSIQNHPNADTLAIAKVLEWPVVVKRGEYENGQLIVFIAIDSVVPKDNPYFSFMERQHYKVWNARFRGSPSSGLVCPISIVNNSLFHYMNGIVCPPLLADRCNYSSVKELEEFLLKENPWKDGDDVSEILGITKYERPIDVSMSGDAKGGFPTNLISISDEDNLLSYPAALAELDGKEIYITQKVDGSSTTFVFNENEFKAFTRRLEMKDNTGYPWTAATKYDVKNKLIALNQNIAIQAESIGPKLNGNTMELKEIEIKVFRVKDLNTRRILGFYMLQDLCKDLGLPTVDVIEVCQFNPAIHTIEYFRKLADSQVWKSNGKPGEGIVIAPTEPFYSEVLGKEWSIKLINQNYK